MPRDVCIPGEIADDANAFPFFDDYSWRAFIALVWPASPRDRGMPDTAHSVAAVGSPRVFETLKASWEVFRPGGATPGAWNAYEDPHPCSPARLKLGDLVLASFSKFPELYQAGIGRADGPLIAQNGTYVRYASGFNGALFTDVVTRGLYRAGSPGQQVRLVTNALVVKSAWMDMTNVAARDRYYRRQALVREVQTGQCVTREVGLVGLHIVQKTPTRPQWIWSTFEHIDNAPPPAVGSLTTFAFNRGDGVAMLPTNPYAGNPVRAPAPPPFNVQRSLPLHPSTQQTNAMYRQALGAQNSVWQFYQLVLTQWPKRPDGGPIDPDTPGTPEYTRPGIGDALNVANTTMETFFQDVGCMDCHNFTRVDTDFVWSLKLHAYREGGLRALADDPAVRQLGRVLQRDLNRKSH